MAKKTLAEFTLEAIQYCEEKTGYKGMHVVWSGFNRAIRDRFGYNKVSSRDAIDQLVADGVVDLMKFKGGVKLYLPGEKPKGGNAENKTDPRADEMLKAIK